VRVIVGEPQFLPKRNKPAGIAQKRGNPFLQLQGISTMRGRKPVPTALKVVRGNPGGRPLNEDEPTPQGDAEMPDYLTPGAAAHWPVVADQLRAAGLLTSVDTHALAMYCEAFARWRHANDQIAKNGPIVKTPTGYPVQSPYLGIANTAHTQMQKLLVEFGMTPSSRSRVTKTSGDEKDEFAAFVKKPRKGNG
jgi:P27 family predicted phage terminase small subunit